MLVKNRISELDLFLSLLRTGRLMRKWSFLAIVPSFLALLFAIPANAQVANFTGATLGSGAGTNSYSAGEYTVNGSGGGISGTADNGYFAKTVVTGNIEMIAKVNSFLEGTATPPNYATAGLMVRDDLLNNHATAYISVSPANGVNFTVRNIDGTSATTTLGPTPTTTQVLLRLVVSGSSVAGYYSPFDGTKPNYANWVLVGKQTIPMPPTYYAGFCVASTTGTASTAKFNPVFMMTAVPQRSANLLTWLRADAGVQTNGSTVTNWQDQSGNGQNASGTTSQPTVVTSSTALPTIDFASAKSQFLQFGSGFKDFTAGYSAFIVLNPTTVDGGFRRILDLSTGATSNGVNIVEHTTTLAGLQVYPNAAYADTSLTTGLQLIEFIQNGNTATAYTNGVAGTTNTGMSSMVNVLRTDNRVGLYNGGTLPYNGKISEILVLSKSLSTAERQAVENYLIGKWSIGGTPQIAAPTITPANSVAAAQQTITITPPAGAVAQYQVNGGGWIQYTSPFTVSSTSDIEAKANAPGFLESNKALGKVQIDPNATAVLQNGLQLWLRADNGAINTGNNTAVTQWNDVSGHDNLGTPANSPVFKTSQINSLPAIEMNGTNQYFTLPSTSAYTAGCSIFFVAKPTGTLAASKRLIDFSNGSTTNSFALQEASSSTGAFINFNGASSKSATANLASGSWQIIDAVYDGVSNATMYVNGVAGTPNAAMNAMVNTTRANNYLGRAGVAGNYFTGQVAEAIVLNTALSSSQREAVERYLSARYAIQVNAPRIDPGTGVYADAAKTVTITSDPGSTTYFTTDGSTPVVGSSPVYSAPFTVNASTAVKAISSQSFGTSPETDSYIAIDPTAVNIPTTGLQSWFRSDIGVEMSSPPYVNKLIDFAKTSNVFQSDYLKMPSLDTNGINGFPAIKTNSAQLVQQLLYEVPPTDFTGGFSLIGVALTKTSGNSAYGDFFDATANNRVVTIFGAPTILSATKAGVIASVSSAANPKLNVGYVFTAIQGSNTGSLYFNGKAVGSGSLPNTNVFTTTPTGFYVYLSYKELRTAQTILYRRGLTLFEKETIEAYMKRAYHIADVPLPVFSVPNGTSFSKPSQVAILAPIGAIIRFSTDGSTPTLAHPIYSVPITVANTQTIKAVIESNGALVTDVTSATYTLDPAKWPAPSGSTAPVINLQLPTPAQ